jgi:hypothetical protein
MLCTERADAGAVNSTGLGGTRLTMYYDGRAALSWSQICIFEGSKACKCKCSACSKGIRSVRRACAVSATVQTKQTWRTSTSTTQIQIQPKSTIPFPHRSLLLFLAIPVDQGSESVGKRSWPSRSCPDPRTTPLPTPSRWSSHPLDAQLPRIHCHNGVPRHDDAR